MVKLLLDLSISKLSRVRLLDGEKVVAEAEGPDTLTLIEGILKEQGLPLKDLEEVASFPGPGSYTGLKVGAAIANALNFTLGKKKRISPIYFDKN